MSIPAGVDGGVDGASTERALICRLDPHSSQRVFRVLLETLARPGVLAPVGELPAAEVPAPLVLPLALADLEVGVATFGAEGRSWTELVCRATGARPQPIGLADIVVALAPPPLDLIGHLRRGRRDAPEEGARLALACSTVSAGSAGPPRSDSSDVTVIDVRGPGVPTGGRRLGVSGLSPEVFTALAAANADFPMGVDTWLFGADGRVAAIPRSAKVNVVNQPTRPEES